MDQTLYPVIVNGMRRVDPSCAHHHRLAKETQCRALDQPGGQQLPRPAGAGFQRFLDLLFSQRPDVAGNETVANTLRGEHER